MRSFRLNRALWIVTGLAAMAASGMGIFNLDLYRGLAFDAILPGIFTQDLLVLLSAILLVMLAASVERSGLRRQIVLLGILGFYFYAYGIYSIEQVYNELYPLYLALLALSFYGLILGFASIQWHELQIGLPRWLRIGSAVYGILIAVMFNFIWISQLLPLLRTGDRIETTFSIIVIDLAFVMPAFVITAIMSLRKQGLGTAGLVALFVLGVGILSPLALAEALQPAIFDRARDLGQLWLYLILSASFFLLAVLNLTRMEIGPFADNLQGKATR